MNHKKSFILVVTFAVYLFGLQTSLWGQESNDIAELKTIITNLEKRIEQKDQLLEKIKKDLLSERTEKERLVTLCREAGINFEKNTESPIEADYQVCQTPIKPGVISGSIPPSLSGFTKIEIDALDWVDTLRIQRIIDTNNAIVEIVLHNDDGTVGIGSGISTTIPCQTVWLKGVQTNGFADDTRQTINHYFAVTGTKTYQTAMGSQKTLYVIEPVILSPKRLKQQTLHYEDLKKQLKTKIKGR
jgi:hypothetical protein